MNSARRAGTVYVEALVVVPLLVALFGGTLWVGRRYDARIVEGQHARSDAWRRALPGCVRALSADDALLPGLRRVEQRGNGLKQVACNELAVTGEGGREP
jgi:hypothetical protein